MKETSTGFLKLYRSFRYSMQGFSSAFKYEEAFRLEVFCSFVLVPAACLLPVGYIDKILLVVSICVVMLVELLNSAIEAVVDRVGHEYHELAGRAKDVASAAVLLSILMAVFVWGVILVQRFL